MSLDPYTISINGGAQTPIDLSSEQILRFEREQNSLSSSFLKIETAEAFSAPSQWANKSQFELFLAGQRIFIGTIIDPTYIADWKTQGRKYLVECPWRRFRRTPYEQTFFAYATEEMGGGVSAVPSAWGSIWTDTSSVTMMVELLNYLIADQIAFPTAPGMIPISIGIVDALVTLRPSKIIDMMVSELAQRSSQFLMDAVHWWDWSQPQVQFNWRTSANMDSVAIPFGKPSVKWNVQESTETQLAFARIVLKVQFPIGSGLNGTEMKIAFAPAGYNGPRLGGFSAFQQLTSLWDVGPAQSFAEQMYTSANALGIKGDVTVLGPGGAIDTRLRPGIVVPMPAGDLASTNGIVFKTQDDLKTGTTVASFNPPRPYSLQALMAMMRQSVPPVAPQEQTEQQTGQSASNNYGMGDNNNPQNNVPPPGPGATSLLVEAVVNSGGTPTPEDIQITGNVVDD